MAVVVSIDAGTTGVRSFALDETGQQLALSYQEFTQHYPSPGWVEHDPNEIWRAVQFTLSELESSIEEPVAAIGITNQRETVVAWNRTSGEPLCNAIVWQDLRTSDRCEQLVELGYLDQIRQTTGLLVNPYFTATKIEWLLNHKVVEKNSDLAFGTVDSWLLWKLTGGSTYATDVTNASRTLLYDIRENRWSSSLCELFGVPESSLPEVLPSSGRFGCTADTSALGQGIPISGIAGDQQSALFGQACLEP
ncbi:MAG: FGGY family carbohydrate kinase, partial [Acidimicrobiales bacterium]|nr:FGGY family carbohydrate kinase [Acidimicrobiales bacterium]